MGWDAGRIRSIVFDCSDPHALASFWAHALRYRLRPYDDERLADLASEGLEVEDDPSVPIDPPEAGQPTVWFNRVPEGKVSKNRVHIDINLDALSEVHDLLELGARVLREPLDDEPWFILADPEGNEFCVFPPRSDVPG